MILRDRILRNERHQKHTGLPKPMFRWCIRCAGFEGCYPEGNGPNFLDRDCYHGPMTEAERDLARQELQDE